MVVQVQKVGETFVIPAQAVHELCLTDGARVEIHSVEATMPATEYVSADEALRVYRKLEPEYREVFAELAK